MSEAPVETLERWEAGGAVWRLKSRSEDEAVVDLLSCTGELMGQVRSSDAALLAYLAERPSSDADPRPAR
jgi:hypothetical protein